MNNFEQKREARAERLFKASEKAAEESYKYYETSKKTVECIPFGQPILVGHHSEKAHRNTIERSNRAMGRSVEEQQKSEDYKEKAEACANNKSIFSDDPEAIIKLKDKIKNLEIMQEKMKLTNKALRKNDTSGLMELGFSEAMIIKLKTPDFIGRTGFPDYRLTNNNANIRRLKQRLSRLEKQSNDITTEKEINGIRIVENVEENRCQVFFPNIPSEEIRKFLKSNGFHWSRYNGCWQRHRSSIATLYADEVLNMFSQSEVT